MKLRVLFIVLIFFLRLTASHAQGNDVLTKQINHNIHSWIGLLTTHRLSDNWGVTADFIVRRDDFLNEPGFYFARLGGGYWFNDNISVTGAYGNLWLYRPQLSDKSFTREHRFDQQLIVNSSLWRFNVTQRFRIESRWREVVEGDQTVGRTFSERIRYLYTFRLPISKEPSVPQLMFSNEILLQFGKQIVNNPLDQIRLFVGIRHSVGKGVAYDFGYFPIFQQTAVGNVYNLNHTVRLLFYFSTRKSKLDNHNLQMEEQE
ncbi:uncharacterized protein DUF2490 [Dysgonomonas alginatilytica]|uniref:Uncharacterized protein DUF2490 n=1 Tax=Dysgonomonas alginatilytica TaxID=1605892 RepID=A0A2V3PL55_9BACT|nr:DUF2490 domain-containing protein [Dysgonomonas alginatilytica]PXV60225.1 uncharacterized protein DUF2490 [Dysgonomonas alginatilytica]